MAIERRSYTPAEEIALTTQVEGCCPLCGTAYDVYRFGAAELNGESGVRNAGDFFERFFKLYKLPVHKKLPSQYRTLRLEVLVFILVRWQFWLESHS